MQLAPTREEDLALMERIADGDSQALKALYDRHAGLVYTLCLRVLRDRAEAEELLVDVFHEVWQKRSRYDATRASPRTYLVMLARSRAIDRKRKHPAAPTLEIQPNDAIDSTSPADQSIDDEQRRVLARAVATLDPSQRQAIECAFYDGLSHSEIAKKLGRPLGTIKTCIRQGLIRLREIVRTTYEEPQKS